MFTGLIEDTAPLASIVPYDDAQSQVVLTLHSPRIAEGTKVGDSIAVNGCCLTATSVQEDGTLTFHLLQETLNRTNLGQLRPGALLNLERALPADGRLGGHFVQGHVDCVSEILALEPHGTDHRLEVSIPPEFLHLVIYKGSITVNGISLTIAEVKDESVVIWIIPHTFEKTNLHTLGRGDKVNLEFDVLAKYMDRLTKLRTTC